MANYSTLKNEVAAVVRTNGQGAITGANMQSTLNKIIDCFGGFWLFGGLASRGNNPGQPDQNVAWIALDPGVYTNYGGVELHSDCFGIIYWDTGHFAIHEVTIGL